MRVPRSPLVVLPLLQHLGVDTKYLLEERRDLLDGADCSNIDFSSTSGSQVSQIMIARLNRSPNFEVGPTTVLNNSCFRVNYYDVRSEQDPFSNLSLLDSPNSAQPNEVEDEVSQIVQVAVSNGLRAEKVMNLKKIVTDHSDIFRTSLSSGPAADVDPLRIGLFPDAKLVKVRLRNYTQNQRNFLSDFVQKLVSFRMAYPNPSSPWSCAPLLVPKAGPSKFRFTVDLRPVN